MLLLYLLTVLDGSCCCSVAQLCLTLWTPMDCSIQNWESSKKDYTPTTPSTPVPMGIFHRPALTSGLYLCLQVNQLKKRETKSLASEPTGICSMSFGNRGWMCNSGWGITHEGGCFCLSHLTKHIACDTWKFSGPHRPPPTPTTTGHLYERVSTHVHTHRHAHSLGKNGQLKVPTVGSIKKTGGLLKTKKRSWNCMTPGKVSVKSYNVELALSTLMLQRK